jgi:hypothetical protein
MIDSDELKELNHLELCERFANNLDFFWNARWEMITRFVDDDYTEDWMIAHLDKMEKSIEENREIKRIIYDREDMISFHFLESFEQVDAPLKWLNTLEV